MPSQGDIFLLVGKPLTRGNKQLLLDNINPGYHFSDRMFNLHTCIHFNKIEFAILVEKLKGTGPAVLQFLAGIGTALPYFVALLLTKPRRRRFLDHLDQVGVRSIDMWTSNMAKNDMDTVQSSLVPSCSASLLRTAY